MSAREWTAPADIAGTRLDRALAAHTGTPRNQVRGWIEAGLVRLDGGVASKAGRELRGGELVEWNPPAAVETRVVGEAGALEILHLDDQIVVLDKPPGIAMHPGAGRSSATLAHRMLGRFPEIGGVGGPGRPGIVHRLDKDTSGVLVMARTAAAYETLSRAFAAREVEKRYLAIAHGVLQPPAGEIDAPIGRHPVKRKQMSVRAGGRRALTLYRTLAETPALPRRGRFCLLELDLKTGRTHQIRVHLQHRKHPIAGDTTYGAPAASGAPRLALHAWRLAFLHPGSGERVEFRAAFAPDLAGWWRELAGSDLPAELD